MKTDSIEAAVHRFVTDEVLAVRNLEPVRRDESLFRTGAVDSISIARIVAFCEERFSISIPEDEIVPEHFETVRAIALMIDRLLNAA